MTKKLETQVTEKKQSQSKSSTLLGCIGCLGFLVLIGIIVLVFMSVTDSGSPDKSANEDSRTSIEEKATASKSYVRSVIKNTVGETTNNNEQKIINLQVNDNLGTTNEQDKIVIATLHANDNMSNNMIKGGVELESIKLLEKLFQVPKIEEVALIWKFPSNDNSLITIMKISITKSTADSIDWGKVDRKSLKSISDNYWELPALRE